MNHWELKILKSKCCVRGFEYEYDEDSDCGLCSVSCYMYSDNS